MAKEDKFWGAQLLIFGRHSWLETLKLPVGIHFGGLLDLKIGSILKVFCEKKWVDFANGMQNLMKVQMVQLVVDSFRHASRSPTVQVVKPQSSQRIGDS